MTEQEHEKQLRADEDAARGMKYAIDLRTQGEALMKMADALEGLPMSAQSRVLRAVSILYEREP